jgi:hypothetical protein
MYNQEQLVETYQLEVIGLSTNIPGQKSVIHVPTT